MAAAIRDPRGRFQIGTPPGPGRPPRATEENYLLAVIDACPLETWTAIVQKTVADAEAGCDKARGWLTGLLIGSPSANKAPAPSAALVARMLGEDEVLNTAAKKLAKPLASAEMFPTLEADSARFRELELEAKQYILALEAETP